MKNLKYLSLGLLAAALTVSCKQQDDYLKYLPATDGSRVGRPETVLFYGGRECVKLYGALSSDPKVTQVGVFWKDGAEKFIFDVDLSKQRVIEQVIPMPEGAYDFEVYTYDEQGNRSMPVNASGYSYGKTYTASLFNRVLKSYKLDDEGNVVIEWHSSPENSTRTEVVYLKQGETEPQRVEIGLKEETTVLAAPLDEELVIAFEVLSYYRPDTLAFEDFAPEKASKYTIDVPPPPPSDDISNGGGPDTSVEGDKINGNWGVPKNWNVSDNVRNQAGSTVGGWKNENGGLFHFESKDWNGPGYENGKLWQSPTLPAGSYAFTVKYHNSDGDPGKEMYLVAAAGESLPDIAGMASALASKEIVSGKTGEYTVSFTLSKPTQVSLGLVITLGGNNGGSNHWLQFKYMKLTKMIVNGGQPVEGDKINGNWGVPKGWNVSDNVRNQAGSTLGGWKNENGGLFHFESKDWGGDGYENGKVWQNPTLPAGNYKLEVYWQRGNTSDNQTIHLVAAAAASLPDRGDLGGALASKLLPRNEQDRIHAIEFTLTEPKQVSLGLLVTLGGKEEYLQFTWMRLTRSDIP